MKTRILSLSLCASLFLACVWATAQQPHPQPHGEGDVVGENFYSPELIRPPPSTSSPCPARFFRLRSPFFRGSKAPVQKRLAPLQLPAFVQLA